MPYFFILPGFVLYVVGMGTAWIVATMYKPLGWLRPYIASVLLWSSAGFLVSTLAYVGVLVLSLGAMDRVLDGRPSVLGGIAMGGLVFVVPFIAAAVGLIGGGVFGLRRCAVRLRASETYQ